MINQNKCNCEIMTDKGLKLCNKPAIWKHPRYLDGKFCEECKENVAYFFPNDWCLLEED